MTRKRYDKCRRRPSRLDRIEQKCDRILSELLIIRSQLGRRRDDIDTTIDRLHSAARNMRECCSKEREIYRSITVKAPQRWI